MSANTFLNFCKWNSTTAGTGSFTVGTAAANDMFGGHDIPANCGAVNGNSYRYFAQSPDGTQYESGRGVYSSGTLTRVTITQNSAGTTTPLNFSVNPVVDMFPHPARQLDGHVVVNYTPVNRAGDTMTGDLLVSTKIGCGPSVVGAVAGDISAVRTGTPTTGVIYLGNSGSRYLYFDGSNYQLGSSGIPWTTGNISPVTSLRTVIAGDFNASAAGGQPNGSEPFGPTAACTGAVASSDGTNVTVYGRYRYLQWLRSDGNWFNFTAG